MSIRYVHTNIIARDWKRLADFYIHVFGCVPVPPERDLTGAWLDKMTLLESVHLRGVHLALPGYEHGPTLEIFSYQPEGQFTEHKRVNHMGYGHLAFHVDDVDAVLQAVLAHGGSQYGALVQNDYPELGRLTTVYVADPEGNLIEIQNWNRDV